MPGSACPAYESCSTSFDRRPGYLASRMPTGIAKSHGHQRTEERHPDGGAGRRQQLGDVELTLLTDHRVVGQRHGRDADAERTEHRRASRTASGAHRPSSTSAGRTRRPGPDPVPPGASPRDLLGGDRCNRECDEQQRERRGGAAVEAGTVGGEERAGQRLVAQDRHRAEVEQDVQERQQGAGGRRRQRLGNGDAERRRPRARAPGRGQPPRGSGPRVGTPRRSAGSPTARSTAS